MPIGNFSATEYASKSNAVVKTRAIVCRLWVYAHKDHNGKHSNKKRLGRFHTDEGIEVIDKAELGNSEKNSKRAANNDIEEAMHPAVESAEYHGYYIEEREQLDGNFDNCWQRRRRRVDREKRIGCH